MASTDSLQWEQSKRVQNNLVINLAGASISYNGSTARNIYLGVADQLVLANNGNHNYMLGHSSDCVTVGYSGPTSDVTLNPGDTFVVPYIQTKKGHVIRLGTYDIGLSADILNRSNIVSNLNSPGSVTVPSSTLLKTNLDKILLPFNSSIGRVEGSAKSTAYVTTKAWTNDSYAQITIAKDGVYFVKATAIDDHGVRADITTGRLSIQLFGNGRNGDQLAYGYIQSVGGDLLCTECCTVAAFETGDILRSQIHTSVTGAKYRVGVYICPIRYF